MPKRAAETESYRNSLLESLKDPEQAAAYLNACLEDGDRGVFLLALRDVADAHGGIGAISKDAHLNRESLYRMMSRAGNPSFESLTAVLAVCGLRLGIKTVPRARKRRAA